MIDKLEETVNGNEAATLFCKTPGLNNPKNYVLSHNRFNNYSVLFLTDLYKAQIYEMPYTDSPHHEIEILMSFIFLNLFKPIELTEDYHMRKPNNENFVFEIGDKKYISVGQKLVCFKTSDKIVENSSELGFNDIKFPFAYLEVNI